MNRPLPALLSILLLAVSVSACAATPHAMPQGTAGYSQIELPARACDVKSLAWTIGQVADDALIERAREEAGAASVRVLRPGVMITNDVDATRLNIRVDNQRKVLSYRCG